MQSGRDFWWHDLMADASADCPAEPLDSEHPLFILYTSGSTGKPKGIKHTTAGYNLMAKKTVEWVFDVRDDDIYWCTADIGWVRATRTSSTALWRPA
jgi:acetyl-CoA synthetase